MSRYTIDKVLRAIMMEDRDRDAFERDPGRFLNGFELSAEERTALADRDYGHLYGAGANPFLLLVAACRLERVKMTEVQQQIRNNAGFAKRYADAVAPFGYPDYET